MISATTFRQLESPTDPNPNANMGDAPLEVWYRSVRDKNILEFTWNDLCKACRQCIYPALVVPVALDVLASDAFAGEKYDGELACSMGSINIKYWVEHYDQACAIALIAASIREEVDDGLHGVIDDLIALPGKCLRRKANKGE